MTTRACAVVTLLSHVFCASYSCVEAFVPSLPARSSAATTSRIRHPRPMRRAQATDEVVDNATTELYDTATQLLDQLLEKRNQDIESPLESLIRRKSPKFLLEQKNDIEALIEKLTFPTLNTQQPPKKSFLEKLKQPRSKSYYYDPSASLFGDFYCTLYFYYPNIAPNSKPPEDPIWEQTSLKASNIKGQQYYVRNDFQQSVINYSEVWGPSVTILAEGVLTPLKEMPKEDSRSLRKLPDVFKVDATKISASVFGVELNFNIEGSANLVVLYADPRIRVFVSPLASETVVGNWEEAGLVVVQVRGDLVPPEKESMPQVIDLR